jgi:2-keto-4-pentenoate hydratase/2-oxohepta-3-ene-1,7-dioic acid hydratase in catechol pathway
MQLGQFTGPGDDAPWPGVVTPAGDIVELAVAGERLGIELPTTLSALVGRWGWKQTTELAVEFALETGTGIRYGESVTRCAPVPDPGKIVCVGLNYREHAVEGDNPIPDEPVLFAKFPTTVNGPNEAIRWDPALTEQVDFEGELVVVIGRETRRVDPTEAWDHIAGYTVGNDVSARDLQHGDGQWVRGKSLDTFAPIGPTLVTPDEIDDPHDLAIWTEVNGERLQDSSTHDLIFGIDELVAFCSDAFTLEPGDLLFTGTPPGVGVYRDPPVLLDEGDTVTVGIESIGELNNPCRFETPAG